MVLVGRESCLPERWAEPAVVAVVADAVVDAEDVVVLVAAGFAGTADVAAAVAVVAGSASLALEGVIDWHHIRSGQR